MIQKWCGTVSYLQGLELQSEAFALCSEFDKMTILGLEHSAVITLGKRLQKPGDNIKISPKGIDIQFTDRGGEATLHSPGQLVVYPVLNIRNHGISVRDYVCALERSVVATLREYGVESRIVDGAPGVYTEHGKIAFVGIRVRNGITQHGLSLNVSNDLGLFKYIKPCGREGQNLDSLSQHGSNATPKEIFERLAAHIGRKLSEAFSLTKTPQIEDSRTLANPVSLRP